MLSAATSGALAEKSNNIPVQQPTRTFTNQKSEPTIKPINVRIVKRHGGADGPAWAIKIVPGNSYSFFGISSCHEADIVIGCTHPPHPPHPTKKLFLIEMDSLDNSKTLLLEVIFP